MSQYNNTTYNTNTRRRFTLRDVRGNTTIPGTLNIPMSPSSYPGGLRCVLEGKPILQLFSSGDGIVGHNQICVSQYIHNEWSGERR